MRILLGHEQRSLKDPSAVIRCHKLAEITPAFEQMEKFLAKGYYLAGFLSYEAGQAFEPRFHTDKHFDFPLLYFGAFKSVSRHRRLPKRKHFDLTPLGTNIPKNEYFRCFEQVRDHLRDGRSYQINYTFKQNFRFEGDPQSLYDRLCDKQPAAYPAMISDPDFCILSHSPELFFWKRGEKIEVRPMKGTLPYKPGQENKLRNDKKNRSENIMIVDLLRNDLGKIARPGGVHTPRLFEVEALPTLFQMTSTVEAGINADLPVIDIFRALFPSGSVTGAPKISSMEIIGRLEAEERKIYTGAIGLITPQREMLFNVAIRTLLLTGSEAEMGIGSGITYSSRPQAEFAECLLKAKFAIDLCKE